MNRLALPAYVLNQISKKGECLVETPAGTDFERQYQPGLVMQDPATGIRYKVHRSSVHQARRYMLIRRPRPEEVSEQ